MDVPDVQVHDDHDLASPDSDRLHVPGTADAPRNTGLYLMA